MKRTILLIDDNKIVTNALETMLVSNGYDVSVANEGADGVELYFQVAPNLVLTDMEMPGVSGENVIRIIKEKNPRQVVVAMSSSEQNKIVAIAAGADQFFKKPVMPNQLIPIIEEIPMNPFYC